MKRTRLSLIADLAAALSFVLASSLAAQAQSAPLSLGTWTTPVVANCAANFLGTNCYTTTISCPDMETITATFGYKIPGTPKGTIIIFSAGGGTANGSEDMQYASDYFNADYAVVQLDWSFDWENTNGITDLTYPYSIRAAACRPATFLELVYSGTISGLYTTNTGFCAQGGSGGSGALGYSLAWYGAGSYTTGYAHLDNVELYNGPMFSDLKQGCETFDIGGVCSSAPFVSICPNGTTQLGCKGWPAPPNLPVSVSPEYVFGSNTWVGTWTGDSSCGVCPPATSNTSNQNWLNQSNVATGASFSYSKTTMAGWLCASVDQMHCQGNQCFLNNASPQGQIFFANFTSYSQFVNLTVNAVNNCQGSEGVGLGIPPAGTGANGIAAIEGDMKQFCVHNP